MLFTSLFLAAALHAQPIPVLLQAQTAPETAEGAEILRRILVDALEKAFKAPDEDRQVRYKDDDSGYGMVSLLVAGQRTVDHSRVFHLPEVGLFFSLDASLPLVEVAVKDEPTGDAPRDDEWERYSREVRRGEGGLPSGAITLERRRKMEIDPSAVDKLIDNVLQTLARHSARIPGLGAQETLTVAVRLGVSGAGFWNADLFATAPELKGEAKKAGEHEPAMFAYTLATTLDGPSQNLVLQVRVGDLAAFANGGTAELRKRARINRY